MILLFVKYRVSDGVNITYHGEEIITFESEDDISTENIKQKCKRQPDSYYRGSRIILDDIKRV